METGKKLLKEILIKIPHGWYYNRDLNLEDLDWKKPTNNRLRILCIK